ncbi:MAG: sensor histidine kinase, partial [Butyrivibrio sp.]|nr:sensor histidine kinase [Butyrivibrio sp.]
ITMNEGNSRYNNYLPLISFIPYLMIGLSVLLFIMAFQVSRMMDKTITEPVLKLADASRRIANNDFFTDDIHVDNKDELGELVMAFNKMKYATGEYILALEERRIALDQLHAREVENLETAKQLETMNLELLKSQINPHFLFNTLNVIGGMANLEDAPTTEQMIGALSSLFRYNLKTQEKETLLSQELKIAGDYMYLQKMRFGDRVSFDLKCGVDADNVMVPTFTFQPLLENCIIHGISPKVEGGRVDVSINRSGDELIITVEDTGIGIEKDVLEKIRQQLEEKADKTVLDKDVVGIGLGNINRRIRSMYQDSAFELDSEKDKGTKISIRIPYNKVIRQDPEE